jgi:hypothetical protein
MLEEWKQAWQEAVANFQRELRAHETAPAQRLGSMRRDLATATSALQRLQAELASTTEELAREQEEVQTCQRRAHLAEQVPDPETVRVANEFASLHAERVAILQRKSGVLQDELALRRRELAAMESALAKEGATVGRQTTSSQTNDDLFERERQDAEFSKLERERKEKAAQAALEELKKKMRG